MKAYLGIDIGSVSTNIVALDEKSRVIKGLYLRTRGQPVNVLLEGMEQMASRLPPGIDIVSVGTTGSGRYLAGVMVGADAIKNEITAHAVAATMVVPDVQTVLEIGGQDSKIIILRQGIVTDFAMNTCALQGQDLF